MSASRLRPGVGVRSLASLAALAALWLCAPLHEALAQQPGASETAREAATPAAPAPSTPAAPEPAPASPAQAPAAAPAPAPAPAQPGAPDAAASPATPAAPEAAPTPPAATPSPAPDTTAQPATPPSTPAQIPAAVAPLPLPAQPAVNLPPRPDDPRAARVYGIFDAHCARCHQTGRLEKPVPAGGLANILALGELAKNSILVMPGVPDASPLYTVMAQGHAPLDIFGATSEGRGPGPDEIGAVREWLRELPGRAQQCSGREPVTAATADAFIEEALRVERDGARDLRFLSLVNLHNACATSEEIAAARQGLARLLNALSWAPSPQPLRAIDPAGTLLAFRLADFGWVAGHWEILQRTYPKALIVPLSDKTRALAGAPNPIVRGDWLAFAVGDPKLYYQLLGISAKLSELAKMNGVDIDYNVRLNRARRAIVRTSAVTRGNRLAERHPGGRGGFWLMYDFASSIGDQDLFERPLGPKISSVARVPFKPDATRVLFSLPNGFLAYALYDPSGNRIERSPPGLEKPIYPGAGETPGQAGAGCFSCHLGGVRHVRDDYRARAAALDPATPGRETREAALMLAGTDGEMLLLANADNERFHNALLAAGIDPALTLQGEDIITALARRYEAGTDFEGAAIELGLDRATLEAALSKATGTTATIARRLQQSRRPRAEIDDLFAYLKGAKEPQAPEAPKAAPAAPVSAPLTPAASGAIALDMWIDKGRPAPGDLIVVNVESNTDCYLTVTNVDGAGKATVVFPNDFEPDNLISAGKAMRVPGAEAPYQLRRKEEGRELIVAQCSTSPAPPTGVEHEFSRQRFTVLGNWENFIEDALITDADLRKSPQKAERARAARASAMRRDTGSRGRTTGDQLDTAPGRNLADGRAVLVIE